MSANQDYFNRGGAYALMFSMAFVFTFFFYLVAIHPGVDLGEKVSDPAKSAGEEQFNIDKVAEPWVPDEKVVAFGAKVYAANCAMCHGDKGLGDGASAAGLNPPPRNLVEGKWKAGAGMIAHFKVLQTGLPGTGMSAFTQLSVGQRWAVVQFIHSITQNKGNDKTEAIAAFAKTAK